MAHIFISYSREDRRAAELLAWHFAQKGWSVWWDRELQGGAPFTRVIARELDSARAVVVVWSQSAIDSNWVIDEAARAGPRIVPILIQNVRPPLGYGSLHTYDLSNWDGSIGHDELSGLLRTLEAVISQGVMPAASLYATSQAPVNVSLPRARVRPKSLLFVGGFAALSVVILIAIANGRSPAQSDATRASVLPEGSSPATAHEQPVGPALNAASPPAALAASALKADIPGAWDSRTASTLVFGKLNEAPWPTLLSTRSTIEVCRPKHAILGEYSLLYPSAESKIVVSDSICAGSDCHACAPDLSIFQFDKTDAGWNLVHSDLAVTPWGQWGQVDKNVSVRVIGNNRFGLVLEGGATGQGEVDTSVTILARISDSYQAIFELTTSSDTAGNPSLPRTSWKAALEVQDRGNTGFFNIKVTREGLEDGKPIRETELWVFDGQKYSKAGDYQ